MPFRDGWARRASLGSVSGFWVEGEDLNRLSSGFFSFGADPSGITEDRDEPPAWHALVVASLLNG